MRLLLLVLLAVSLVAAKAPFKNKNAKHAVRGDYIVVYKSDVNDPQVAKHETEIIGECKRNRTIKGIRKKFKFKGFHGYLANVDAIGLEKILESPLVDYVDQDFKITLSSIAVPAEQWIDRPFKKATLTQAPGVWGLERISHRNANQPGYIYDSSAGSNTRIYIVDSGILTTHTQFGGRAVWGANFIAGSPNTDEYGHGTNVAGIAGGKTYGVAKLSTLVAVKVFDKNGAGTVSSLISGIQWSVNNALAVGAKQRSVINLSLGCPFSQSINNAVQSAVVNGITVVTAAGNGDVNGGGIDASTVSPASSTSVITVAAIDKTDTRPKWSNFGAAVDVFAPGVSIQSAWIGNNNAVMTMTGTSMAAPHVAGLAAYLIAKENLPNPAFVMARLLSLATTNKVIDPKGAANRIAYNGNGA